MRKKSNSKAGAGRRIRRTCAAYLLAASAVALGWLYNSLPDHILLEPGQALQLPRFAYIEPLGSGSTRNVVSTQTVGSYQTTLSIGGGFPVKNVQAGITPPPTVTVCGTPLGGEMFSEGALVGGFTGIKDANGTPGNPSKEAGPAPGGRGGWTPSPGGPTAR